MKRYRNLDAVRTRPWRQMAIVGTCVVFAACALAILAGTAQGKGDAGEIAVTLEPGEIRLGEAAVLSVHMVGNASGRPSIPQVEGLRLTSIGQSTQYQSINGRVSQVVSYLFQVAPERGGEFTLPPITAKLNGQVMTSEPVLLRVSDSVGAAAPARSRAALPPPSAHGSGSKTEARLSADEADQWAFLRVTPLKLRAYVGERVPVEVQAFFRQGLQASLNSFPMFQGQAFAWQELSDKPEQSEQILDGIPHTVLIWHTAMSGVKEGEYPVSAELDATLAMPQRSRRQHPFGRGFFDDDFFDGFFAGAREETVRMTSVPKQMRVLPLPKAGRPKEFTGAVGRFKLSASASPQDGMVGDPITLKIAVKGTGNFDRVSCPELTDAKDWRTYTPTEVFKPSDRAGCEGRKSFERAIIPQSPSIDAVPALAFSYFDTAKEAYVTLRTQPIQLKIAPDTRQAQAPASGHSGSAPPLPGTSAASESRNETGGLAPIQTGLGPVTASLIPIFENPWFMGAQGIPLGTLFVGLFMTRRNRRRANDPSLLRKKETRHRIGQSVRDMDRAISSHDGQAFFTASRRAAQERLGELWGQVPQSITLADVRERLGETGDGIRRVFENADAATYSGRTFSQEELRDFRDLVMRELKGLRELRN